MAINKANSPLWMKVTLIILIVAFVLSFVTVATLPSCSQETDDTSASTDTTTSAQEAQYQSTVAALTSSLQSEPESYTVLVSLGNAYFDWASVRQSSTEATAGADLPLWVSAKDAYTRAIAVDDSDLSVHTDLAIVTFYSGDTQGAITVAEAVLKEDPDFSPALFNLGVFYQASGDDAAALKMFQHYLEVDPNGESGGNPDYATQQVEALQGSTSGN